MSSDLVTVSGLSRTFDVSRPWLNRVLERRPRSFLHAVRKVSFSIPKGQTFALVGESGSGKSTVAKMVVGLLQPSAGRILIDGVDMWPPKGSSRSQSQELRRVRRRVQMIFQDPYASLNPRWRVDNIIAEPIRAFGLLDKDRAIRIRIGELLSLVGLDPRDGRKYPHEFSGGQRQRICIARALATNPEFLVCDEPTSALDVSVQAQILNLMRDLQDQFNLTYLLISHDLAVVRHMANRIGVLYLGRLAEEAPSKMLFHKPRHPYTRMLLEAVPVISAEIRQQVPVQGEIPNPINPPSGCTFHPRCPFVEPRCRAEEPELCLENEAAVACHGVAEGRI